MPPHHATPKELVQALQHGLGAAREELRDRIGESLRRLLEVLRTRRGSPAAPRHDPEMVFRNVLHSLAVYLRSRPVTEFDGMNWEAFQKGLLVQAGKMVLEPHGGLSGPVDVRRNSAPSSPTGSLSLPASGRYHNETFFLPHEQIGTHRFGGDWYGGRHSDDGSLWVIVADVTGHGYHAYLLASCLPHLWSLCWEALKQEPEHPADLLRILHERLEESLPEGVYVEATLARFRPDGQVVLSPGGGSRVLVRQDAGSAVRLHRFRGGWLGFMAPSLREQQTLSLAEGDELLLGTDGLFDQLEAALGPTSEAAGAPLPEQFPLPDARLGLFDAVHRLLQQALRRLPQKDDITMVLLRRRTGEW
jgi:hypothetical protein